MVISCEISYITETHLIIQTSVVLKVLYFVLTTTSCKVNFLQFGKKKTIIRFTCSPNFQKIVNSLNTDVNNFGQKYFPYIYTKTHKSIYHIFNRIE